MHELPNVVVPENSFDILRVCEMSDYMSLLLLLALHVLPIQVRMGIAPDYSGPYFMIRNGGDSEKWAHPSDPNFHHNQGGDRGCY